MLRYPAETPKDTCCCLSHLVTAPCPAGRQTIYNKMKNANELNWITQYPVGKRNVITRRSSRGPKGSTSHLISWKSSEISWNNEEYPPETRKLALRTPNFTLRTRNSPSETPNFALRPQISPPETPYISNYRPKHRATRDVIFRLFHFHGIRCLPHNVCMPPPPPTSVCNEIANKRVFSGQVFGL